MVNIEKSVEDLEFLGNLSEEDKKIRDAILKKKQELIDKQTSSTQKELLAKSPSQINQTELASFVGGGDFLKDKQEFDALTSEFDKRSKRSNEYRDLYRKSIGAIEQSIGSAKESTRNRIKAIQAKFSGLEQAAAATATQETGSRSAGLRAAAQIEGRKQEPIGTERANLATSISALQGQKAAILQQQAEATRNQSQFDKDLAFKKSQLSDTATSSTASNSGTGSSSTPSYYSPSSSVSSSSSNTTLPSSTTTTTVSGDPIKETQKEEKALEEKTSRRDKVSSGIKSIFKSMPNVGNIIGSTEVVKSFREDGVGAGLKDLGAKAAENLVPAPLRLTKNLVQSLFKK